MGTCFVGHTEIVAALRAARFPPHSQLWGTQRDFSWPQNAVVLQLAPAHGCRKSTSVQPNHRPDPCYPTSPPWADSPSRPGWCVMSAPEENALHLGSTRHTPPPALFLTWPVRLARPVASPGRRADSGTWAERVGCHGADRTPGVSSRGTESWDRSQLFHKLTVTQVAIYTF